jgi:S-adenosylmethionine-diacylglycerol 3-amino-3-carboxypropyl transferase
MFGIGSHAAYRELYSSIRKRLPYYAKAFWDNNIQYFDSASRRKSFYYHGPVGTIVWLLIRYLLRPENNKRFYFFELLDAKTLEEQREIYRKIEPVFWSRFFTWVMKQPVVLVMMGVPGPQYQLIKQYPGGITGYVHDTVKHVFTKIMIRDNYFWRVYLTGSYTQTCCPNYLRKEYFSLLQAIIGKVYTYDYTIIEFLKRNPGTYTHFVLLDHQDWLAWHDSQALREEWQLLLDNSRPGSKILMRSALADISFLPEVAKSSLRFFPEKSNDLHKQDRVSTYGSLHLAEIL